MLDFLLDSYVMMVIANDAGVSQYLRDLNVYVGHRMDYILTRKR